MRVRPLRAIDRVGGGFHPTESCGSMGEVFGERIAGRAPLRALVAGLRQAHLLARSRRGVDLENSTIRMISVAEHFRSCAIRGDVPGVELRDRSDGARGPVHRAQSARPYGEHEIAAASEKCLMHDELIIAVLI